MSRRFFAGAAMAAMVFGVCAAPAAFAQAPASTPAANDYAQASAWLCRPGREDACSISNLTSTVIAPDGTMTQEAFAADHNAPIDCFYVYPTVSRDPTGNSDMVPDIAEFGAAAVQAARFGAKCRIYAPMYRQVTSTALAANMSGRPMQSDSGLAYNDVRDAWNHYLAHDNNGRGVVLIGHSQGTGVLSRLIAREIDGKPVQARLVSALLIGASVSVPRGANVGGEFQHVPACRSATQIGCVISYAAYRDTVPPAADSWFTHPYSESGAPDPNLTTICTNPANLAGGSGVLHTYLTTTGELLGSPLAPRTWTRDGATVNTIFASTPGLVSAQCVTDPVRGTYLAIHVNADPADARLDDIAGDVRLPNGQFDANWGLHLVEMQLTMGNLVDLVGQQAAAYKARR